MAKLTLDEVAHVAKLANIPLTELQMKMLQKQLSEVVDYIDELQKVDTTDVDPTSQTTGLENVMRTDEVQVERILTQEEALSGSDKVHNGFFMVPMVLEEKKDV